MRIGVVVDNEFDHDVRVKAQHLILSQAFGEVPVLCYDFGVKELDGASYIHRFKKSRGWRNRWFGLQNSLDLYARFWGAEIARFVREQDLDVIHVHDLYMAKAAKKGTKGTKCKIVLDLHENYPATVLTQTWATTGLKARLARPRRWKKKERSFLAKADHIVTLSDAFAQQLATEYQLDKAIFTTIPNVPNLESYDLPEVEFAVDKPLTLCYYGGVAERRGVLWLMDEFMSQNLTGRFKLKIIGPVDGADSARFHELLGRLGDSCEYVPWIENRKLLENISDTHVGLCPIDKNEQHESGVANKVFQYMMCGLPVLVSNCRPQQDVIEEHDCGWVYEARNSDSLLKALAAIEQTSMSDLSGLGENGRTAVNTSLNSSRISATLLSIYDQVLGGSKGSR
jgi:glycosyltransferase involved in cell wall biosynthesis